MDDKRIQNFIQNVWKYENGAQEDKQSTIVGKLMEFIKIQNDSPDFDANWLENGRMYQAARLLAKTIKQLSDEWAAQGCDTSGISLSLINVPKEPDAPGSGGQYPPPIEFTDLPEGPPPAEGPDGKALTPLLLLDIQPFGPQAHNETVLLYGHMDKQPGLEGQWKPGLGPRQPVIKDGQLYGRGGADDGYALFNAFSSVMALRQAQLPHARCVILIEACEESGSIGLDDYLAYYKEWLKDVTLIVCLDSGCEDWERLWLTNSLRGLVNGVLEVRTIKNGVHSGDASGIVPSSFRILNQLIARVENPETGEITPKGLKVDLEPYIIEQAKQLAGVLGEHVYTKYNFCENPDVQPVTDDLAELVLNRTWRSQLSITGMEGCQPPGARATSCCRLPPPNCLSAFRPPWRARRRRK